MFYKAQWFSHVRYLPNPTLFKTQTQKADCKPLAKRLTWYLERKRLWSPLSNKVQISPTSINTLSEKYAAWAKVFNHEIIWLYVDLWFSPMNLAHRIQTAALAVSLIQMVNCVNAEECRLLYKGIQVTGTSLSVLTYPEYDWAAPGAPTTLCIYLTTFLSMPPSGKEETGSLWKWKPRPLLQWWVVADNMLCWSRISLPA